MTYAYNLSGAMIEQQYPSGRKVQNTLDSNGDLAMVGSGKCLDGVVATTGTCTNRAGIWGYAGNFTYNASGAVTSMQLGNGRWESTKFNTRLQPVEIALGTVQNGTDKLKLAYSYGTTANNGNVLSQTITVPTVGASNGFTAVQSYSYDEIKRLRSSIETVGGVQSWKQAFNYDRYGNRSLDTAQTTTIPAGCSTAVCNPTIDPATNRLSASEGYDYDAVGNLAATADGQRFVYDANNKLVEVRNESTNALLTANFYDGDGLRVKVDENDTRTIFAFDASTRIVAEYSSEALDPIQNVEYLTTDFLKTPRVLTDENGRIVSRRDTTPFGEDVGIGVGGRAADQRYGMVDDVRAKFTGQLRDLVANLDYFNARHYSYDIGRFTSADSFGGKVSNPQTLNLYAYVLNNPLRWVDPTGHYYDDPDDCVKDGTPQCTKDAQGKVIKPDGTDYQLDSFCVDVCDGCRREGNLSTRPNARPEMAASWMDWIPVLGPLRGFAFNYNCRTGGCNIDRALGNFVLLASDLSPVGAYARVKALAKPVIQETGEMFAKEVVAETLEIGGETIIREPQSLMDQMVLDAAKNGAGNPINIELGDPAFKGMIKMTYGETSANGLRSEVHFVKDPSTGLLMDFKFKPSTIQKTNSVAQYANRTKYGTIVAPR